MKVLITGATGFVGSHLVDYLLDNGIAEVYGIIRPRSRSEFVRKEAYYHEADILDYTSMASIVDKVEPEYVFHLAAQSFVPLSWKAPSATLSTNIIGTLNILEAVKNARKELVLLVAGSSEEYGLVKRDETPITEDNPLRPLSPYGVSKVTADLLSQQYHKSYGVRVVITRAFNHEGPRRGEVFVSSSFAKQIAEIEKGKEAVIYTGDLGAERDFTDVRDMVRAYWLAINQCKRGTPYNICSGKAYRIGKLLKILLGFTEVGVSVEQVAERMRPSDVPLLLGSRQRFEDVTGWKPEIPFEKTLEDLLNYWRERV